MGITETILFVRLSSMDFRMMSIEWDGITNSDIDKMKEKVKELISIATIIPSDTPDESKLRKKLRYGRVILSGGVQSFEYLLAQFGAIEPPLGSFSIEISNPPDGCESDPSSELDQEEAKHEENLQSAIKGKILITKRGNCTFLSKALRASRLGARGLIVVNHDDHLEEAASGYGIDPSVTEKMVTSLVHFPVLTVINGSWVKFEHSVRSIQSILTPTISMVPLQCSTSGSCSAVHEEERKLLPEVTWGTITLQQRQDHDNSTSSSSSSSTISAITSSPFIPSSSTSSPLTFQFLTSNFGGRLPLLSPLDLVLSSPIDACSSLILLSHHQNNNYHHHYSSSNLQERYQGKLVVVERGGCRFDLKAKNVQDAGGRAVLIVEKEMMNYSTFLHHYHHQQQHQHHQKVNQEQQKQQQQEEEENDNDNDNHHTSSFSLIDTYHDFESQFHSMNQERDRALQRIGGMAPESGYIGIPSLILSSNFQSIIQLLQQFENEKEEEEEEEAQEFKEEKDKKEKEMKVEEEIVDSSSDIICVSKKTFPFQGVIRSGSDESVSTAWTLLAHTKWISSTSLSSSFSFSEKKKKEEEIDDKEEEDPLEDFNSLQEKINQLKSTQELDFKELIQIEDLFQKFSQSHLAEDVEKFLLTLKPSSSASSSSSSASSSSSSSSNSMKKTSHSSQKLPSSSFPSSSSSSISSSSSSSPFISLPPSALASSNNNNNIEILDWLRRRKLFVSNRMERRKSLILSILNQPTPPSSFSPISPISTSSSSSFSVQSTELLKNKEEL